MSDTMNANDRIDELRRLIKRTIDARYDEARMKVGWLSDVDGISAPDARERGRLLKLQLHAEIAPWLEELDALTGRKNYPPLPASLLDTMRRGIKIQQWGEWSVAVAAIVCLFALALYWL